MPQWGLTWLNQGTTFLGVAGEWNDIIGSSKLYYLIEFAKQSGLKQKGNRLNLRVYPNPTRGVLNFEFTNPSSAIKTLEIRGIDGRLIIQQNCQGSTASLTLTDLPAGVYVYTLIDTKGYSYTDKILVE